MVTISTTYVEWNNREYSETVEKKEYSINTEQLILRNPMKRIPTKIDGLEKLINVKRIAVWINLDDYSFLKKMTNLEILLLRTDKVFDFDLLYQLPKIKILYINSVILKQNQLDFKNNKQLEFVYLSNVRGEKITGLYELTLKNLPKSLQCIDFSVSVFIIINRKLLDSLKDVGCIILYKEPYFNPQGPFKIDDLYLLFHPNIKMYKGKEVLPEKYQYTNIFLQLGLDSWGRSLKTGEYVWGP